MKELNYKIGYIEITISCSDEDYEWMYALFTRNSNPFKALRDMGYMPVGKKDETQDQDDP